MSMGLHTSSTPIAKETLGTRFSNNMQHPGLAIPIVTVVIIAVMLGVFWLLKRFTSWQFPINKKG